VLAELDRIGPDLVLLSLEAAPDATLAAARWCSSSAVPLLVNPAPMQPWARDLLGDASWLTPNEHELEELGTLPSGLSVVETRGPAGAVVRVLGSAEVRVAAPRVDAVDATGAGDCLNGVLAAGLAQGLDLVDAVRRAVAAASLAVTVVGAREGMPTREEIDRAAT